MYQVIEQTDEEKFRMYNKLSKKEIILMLIEANKHLGVRTNTIIYSDDFMKPPYEITSFGDLCSCNPKNGGSGICNCTMASQIIKRIT